MKSLKLLRSSKDGFRSFLRNKWLTVATVFVLALSLYTIGIAIMSGLMGRKFISDIEGNTNINVYLNTDVSVEEVDKLKELLESTNEIESIEYVSNEDALKDFLSKTNNDPMITQAIDEIGENPLFSYFVVRANNPENYEAISVVLEGENFSDKINYVNYGKNKDRIDKLNDVVKATKKIGMIIGGVFIVVSFLIVFNTIRLNMYSRKKEFEVMRLVGASNLYIQAPLFVEGILYGAVSAVFAIVALSISIYFVSPVFKDTEIIAILWQYFFTTSGLVLVLGALIGLLSSFVAIRRYLKI